MKVDFERDTAIIEGLINFYPQHIFECGQSFRWNWDNFGYIGVAQGKVIRIRWDKSMLYIENTTPEDFHAYWKDYFDLGTDYSKIIKNVSQDSVMGEAVKYGWGIRILNQDPWETLISFIISANNNINRIKLIIENLSQNLGEKVLWHGKTYYAFPSALALANAREDELRECGCGYRGPYIKKTASLIQNGIVKLDSIRAMEYKDAKEQLMKCPGIGPKVADCVLLFSLGKTQAFPIDVWIKRIVETLYLKEEKSAADIRHFAEDRFGTLAGYAQQYLFYYAREKGIGR